jgi:hypothetical protein
MGSWPRSTEIQCNDPHRHPSRLALSRRHRARVRFPAHRDPRGARRVVEAHASR